MELNTTQQEPVPDSARVSLNILSYLPTISFLVLFFFVFMIPSTTNASIFSNIADLFTNDVKAQSAVVDEQNSQTAPVLEAKMSPNGDIKKSETPIQMNQNDVLISEVGTLGTSLDVTDYPETDEISIYIVKSGDSIGKIAETYNVSINTIVWANDGLDPKKALKEGTVLLIMPINGVSHTVKKGDTINKIAKKYGADPIEIARFNGITDETLIIGDIIMVPNGEITTIKAPTKNTNSGTKNSILNIFSGNGKGTSPLISGYGGSSAGSYYRAPVRCTITQGLHGKNGIDIGCRNGTPVAAAADGTVIAARTGWNGGYGVMVIVSHPNGTQTLYGHLSKLNVSNGQYVNDGDIIGYTGNTGQSTGPHLHFEIRGARNCYTDNSCR